MISLSSFKIHFFRGSKSQGDKGQKNDSSTVQLPTGNNTQKPLVFVLMPFDKKFDDLFQGIEKAATKANARAERVDKQNINDKDVIKMILQQIDKAEILVAVTSDNKPNVFYEIGLAHAIRKHVVLLTKNTKEIPYDLSFHQFDKYTKVDDEFVTKLSKDLIYHLSNPIPAAKYYQEFKSKFIDFGETTKELMPFFLPIAGRYLQYWSDYISKIISDGEEMSGEERWKITKQIAFKTRIYSLIEQVTGDPESMHSKDWRDLYIEIGEQADIRKTWILFVKMDDVIKNRIYIKKAWEFFRQNNFITLYCSHEEFYRATGKNPPEYQVIENFGDFVKLLRLQEKTYTTTEVPNMINTTFKVSKDIDNQLLESITRCSVTMDREWINNICTSSP
jgi:hypothetical protein